jgi:broad specificity phosphatase PhoE
VRLILVRHGESVGNFENRLQGHTDYDLTPKGHAQASLTAERLLELGVAAVYTSPLLRASATARIIGERIGCGPVELPGVREYDFGELAGETYAELRQRFAANPVGPDGRPADRVYPGEEGREAFLRRVTEAMWQVVERHSGETVAIVSHGGPIALLCQNILGLPYKRPMPFAIDNCSLSIVHVRDGASDDLARPRAILAALNDRCHLRGAGDAAPVAPRPAAGGG